MTDLWNSQSIVTWRGALDAYEAVVAAQRVAALPELDRWYRHDLGSAIVARRAPHVTSAELVELTEWKMARGVWRAPNLVLVRGNTADSVIETSTRALAAVPHPTSPIATLAKLHGVGPATASAVVAAFAPQSYPFFDELVAAQVPTLGKVAWTLKYYGAYAAALRERAEQLGGRWTPAMVERALWSHVGGKNRVSL
ncbi:MAG: hypothetical protein ABI205_06480 [Gemmatimonadaceae bacterium]